MPAIEGFARKKLVRDPDNPPPEIPRAPFVELG